MQQELADSLKKQSMTEASLEVSTRYRIDLEEDKQQFLKEIERMKCKVCLQQFIKCFISSTMGAEEMASNTF